MNDQLRGIIRGVAPQGGMIEIDTTVSPIKVNSEALSPYDDNVFRTACLIMQSDLPGCLGYLEANRFILGIDTKPLMYERPTTIHASTQNGGTINIVIASTGVAGGHINITAAQSIAFAEAKARIVHDKIAALRILEDVGFDRFVFEGKDAITLTEAHTVLHPHIDDDDDHTEAIEALRRDLLDLCILLDTEEDRREFPALDGTMQSKYSIAHNALSLVQQIFGME